MNAGCVMNGNLHRELVSLDYYLWSLTISQYIQGFEYPDSVKGRLLSFGFPVSELTKLSEAGNRGVTNELERFEENLPQKFPHIFKPQEVSIQELEAFLKHLHGKQLEIRKRWVIQLLNSLSPIARRAMMTHIMTVDRVNTIMEPMNLPFPEKYTESIHTSRTLRLLKRHHWSVDGSFGKRMTTDRDVAMTSDILPSLVLQGTHPVWMKAESIRLVEVDDSTQFNLLQDPGENRLPDAGQDYLTQKFSRYLKIFQKTKNIKGDCFQSHYGLQDSSCLMRATGLNRSGVVQADCYGVQDIWRSVYQSQQGTGGGGGGGCKRASQLIILDVYSGSD